MKKKILALLAACLLLTGCTGLADSLQIWRDGFLPDATLAELPYIDPNITTSFEPAISQFYYDQLPGEAEQKIYRAYLEFLKNDTQEQVYIKGSYNSNQVANALYALQSDYPQFLTCSWGYTFTYLSTSSGTPLGIEIAPVKLDEETLALQGKLYSALSRVLTQAKAYDDVWQRQLFLYENVIEMTAYDTDTANIAPLTQAEQMPLTSRLAHTAYGSLVQQGAVCDGYAYAFQLLCNYAGIPAATVTGMSFRGTRPETQDYVENHAWNVVFYGEDAYYCDPTWDDNGAEYLDADGERVFAPADTDGLTKLAPEVLHRYFNLSYEELAGDHVFSPQFTYPQQTASQSRDYYTAMNLEATTPQQLAELVSVNVRGDIPAGGRGFELRVRYDTESLTDEVFQKLYATGIRGRVLVSYPPNGTGCCYIFLRNI